MEAPMQRFPYRLDESDRRTVRKWRWRAVGLYGSILAGLIVWIALNKSPDVNYASNQAAPNMKVVSVSKR
jgi:hypothetical protein